MQDRIGRSNRREESWNRWEQLLKKKKRIRWYQMSMKLLKYFSKALIIETCKSRRSNLLFGFQESIKEKEEKIKCLQEELKEKPGSHPSNEVIVEENQRTVVEFCKNENSNLVLPADEVGEGFYESRITTSISQEDLEELMTSIKKDPYLRPIIEDIETGMMSGSRNMTLSTNARIRRNKHARQNWKNKMERKNLEAKGQTAANVNEVAQVLQQGPDYRDL
ncbi:hypothetical protein MKW92_006013 [Papaver armeniacum]|nr:hypothetical protein MKW92_006013 [Papaver armeniacum]